MGRLTALPPTVGRPPARIGRAPLNERQTRDQRQDVPWRKWYSTKRWRDLRQQALIRDAYTCQRTGVICSGTYPADNSPTVNHKVAHRGNPKLFWDIDNLETVTKSYHDQAIQAQEQADLMHKGVWD